jgi:hypothetical protein
MSLERQRRWGGADGLFDSADATGRDEPLIRLQRTRELTTRADAQQCQRQAEVTDSNSGYTHE